ncbi:MAG: mercuric reductase [Cyanobacteria bacterium P01_A01_bin.135]
MASLTPLDHHNFALLSRVHPPDWPTPHPAKVYNLVVIGGGTAGLVTAGGTGMLGGKVALVEKHLLGGDCTNVGCIPSKTLIRAARAAHKVRQAHRFGVMVPDGVGVDFPAVMERVRQVRADISRNDSAERMRDEYGVDVFFGEARFTGPHTIALGDLTLRFKKAVIATGSSPVLPPIEGLDQVEALTNETIFNLTQQPRRLAVVGGGYIGCELAQAFGRLGTAVTLLQRGDRLLNTAEPEVSALLQRQLADEGVDICLNADVTRVEQRGEEKVIHCQTGGETHCVTADALLLSAGRAPNLAGLGLAQVGVEADPRQGILIDDYLQTSNPDIYAVGDCCMAWRFTHAADAAARIAIQNALFAPCGIGRRRLSELVMPSCTYTDPEVAHVGISAEEAAARSDIRTFEVTLDDVDRAIADGETVGFAKIYLDKRRDKILGATVVAAHAGEMINEITLAITQGLGLGAIADVIHPYPTQAEVIRKAAEEYSLAQFTPLIKKLAAKWLAWRR